MSLILSSCKISEKHFSFIKRDWNYEIEICENMEEAKKYISKAEILLTYGDDVTKEIAEMAQNLKWIHVLSAGVELLPFDILIKNKVIVTNSKGIHAIPISEYVIGSMLMLCRGFNQYMKNQEKKIWDRKIKTEELYGKKVAIIGLGSIGRGIYERLQVFGVEIYGLTRRDFSKERLKDILSKSDFVIITVPLTPETEGLIGKDEIDSMKRDAYLINISRGKVIDEGALIDALRDKRIKGAVLDVFQEEPLPLNSPLWEMENVIVTPHISGLSPFYMERAMKIFEENMHLYMEGKELINLVDLEKGY